MAPGLTLRRAQRLRRTMTHPEVVLWLGLRSKKLSGLRFRRQHPVGPWIVDFYCPALRLAVEVDGQSHGMGELGYDARRDADLLKRGVKVLRFSAVDVTAEIEAVLDTILAEAEAAVPSG